MEFAAVSIPFFILLFAILETALTFFTSQLLDNAVSRAARQIRTGEASAASMDADGFAQAVCSGLFTLASCAENLHVDVTPVAAFADYAREPVIDESGELVPMTFDAGGSGGIIIVRAFYEWPVFFNMFVPSGTELANGNRLLGSVVAFRNEPFPW